MAKARPTLAFLIQIFPSFSKHFCTSLVCSLIANRFWKKIQFQRYSLNYTLDHTQVVAVFFIFTSVVITVSSEIWWECHHVKNWWSHSQCNVFSRWHIYLTSFEDGVIHVYIKASLHAFTGLRTQSNLHLCCYHLPHRNVLFPQFSSMLHFQQLPDRGPFVHSAMKYNCIMKNAPRLKITVATCLCYTSFYHSCESPHCKSQSSCCLASVPWGGSRGWSIWQSNKVNRVGSARC